MKLVINLPNDWEELVREMSDSEIVGWLYGVCRNGTVLPKGHGDLKDAKQVYKKFYCRCLASVARKVLDELPTIIEADTEGDVYAD